MKMLATTAAAALMLAGTAAFAQDQTDTDRETGEAGFSPAADFSEYDSDGDGMISQEEFMDNAEGDEDMLSGWFDDADENEDDMISENEMSQAMDEEG